MIDSETRPHFDFRAARVENSGVLKATLKVFLLLNCLYLITSTGRVRVADEALTLFQAQSLVLRGELTVPQALETGRFYGKYDLNGKPRAPYPPMHALLVSPWYAVGHFLLTQLPGIPASNQDLVVAFAVTLSSATFASLTGALAFVLFLRKGLSFQVALASTAILTLATPLFSYSGWFFSEPLTSSLLMSAVVLLFGHRNGEAEPPSLTEAILAGAFLGATLFVRPVHLIATPSFLAALLIQHRMKGIKSVLRVGSIVAIAAVGYLVWNWRLYGSALEFGYPPLAEGGRQLNTFQTPIYLGLFGFLFAPGKSVFLFAPPIVLALAALPRLWRDPKWRGLACVTTLVPLTYLLFYSTYTQWEGGYCFGPRYLIPPLLLLCIGVGPLLSVAGREHSIPVRKVVAVVFVAGLIVQLIGLSTSFLEDQANGTYYDEHWNYRLDYSIGGQSRLLLKYLTSSAPVPLGKGLDRWFVFLWKAGLPVWIEALILSLAVAGMALTMVSILRTSDFGDDVRGHKSLTE